MWSECWGAQFLSPKDWSLGVPGRREPIWLQNQKDFLAWCERPRWVGGGRREFQVKSPAWAKAQGVVEMESPRGSHCLKAAPLGATVHRGAAWPTGLGGMCPGVRRGTIWLPWGLAQEALSRGPPAPRAPPHFAPAPPPAPWARWLSQGLLPAPRRLLSIDSQQLPLAAKQREVGTCILPPWCCNQPLAPATGAVSAASGDYLRYTCSR